jgi:phage repressor protein C with HTH and peptisase S24 domain
MGESNERLEQARIAAGYKSARQAAIRHGWVPSTYASHENGQTDVPIAAAKLYGRAFKVSPEWIVYGRGSMEARNMVEIVGLIGLGAQVTKAGEKITLELPFDLKEAALAFRVDGPALRPAYENGQIVITTARSRDPGEMLEQEVVAELEDGRCYFKTLREGSAKGLYTLESLTTLPIADQKLKWVGSIIAILPTQQSAQLYEPAARSATQSR